jgi:hypothetical protein
MGLDITAYSKLMATNDPDADYIGSQSPEFAARADGLAEGRYAAAKTIHFRAGSYSGYNEWREMLAELAGYPKRWHEPGYKAGREMHAQGAWEAPSGPFWELINFSDCEGYIGPKTSAKLAQDFADFQAKADEVPDDWFRNRYAEWRKAFELARDDGAVDFH